jgi:hypothetical protein
MGRIMVQGQPQQIVPETLSPKITKAKWTGGMAQMVVKKENTISQKF